MTRRAGRSAAALLLTVALLAVATATAAHSPDPGMSWALWAQNQDVAYRWLGGAVPPANLQAAVNAAASDANTTRWARAATLRYSSSGASTVQYAGTVFCGVNGLACADASNAPTSFRLAYREQGHKFDWGSLQWCQLQSTVTNGCFDAEMVGLHEFGHVLGLGHHLLFDDQSDYRDSVMEPVGRARPADGWNVHAYERCDVATLQLKYDMLRWESGYSTCLDLASTLTLSANSTTIHATDTVTFAASLRVATNSAYSRLSGNPVSSRTVVLQRRSQGTTAWSTVGTMTPSGDGLYTLASAPTQTFEWRALFSKPATEGLRGSSSSVLLVSVVGCANPCPQSAPADGANQAFESR